MMSRMEMICSRCDWLIPVWMMSMSKRPSSPATLPIQYSTIRTARSASSAVTASLSRLREADDRLELAWGDRDTGTRRFPCPSDVQVFFLDDRHGLDRHDGVDAFRVGHVLAQEVRIQVRRVRFLEGLRLLGGQPGLAPPPDLADAVAFQDVLRQLPIAVRLRAIDHGEDDVETAEQGRR